MAPVTHTARGADEEVAKEDSPDCDQETRTLCDYMVHELEKGIRLQRTSDFKDITIRYVADTPQGPALRFSESALEDDDTGSGTGAGGSDEGECHPLATIASVTGRPETTQRGQAAKLFVVVAFKEPADGAPAPPPVTFQGKIKEKNAYINVVDGIGALLGRAPATYERVRNRQTITELYRLAQLYGPPPLPPPPS